MDDALKILVLEDVATDAELMLRALRRGGVRYRARVVASEADFRRGLDEFEPDIILSDFALPDFDGMSALRMARARRPDTPFLFVSGTIGEERAVETLKEGASDYVIKSGLQRLPLAVQKALEAQRLRAAKRETDEALRDSEARYRGIVKSVMECIITVDERQRIVVFNPAAEQVFGRSREEMLGQPLGALIPERFRARHEEHIRAFAATGHTSRSMGRYGLIYGLRASGEEFPIEATISQTGTGRNRLFTVILRDITERMRVEQALRGHTEQLRRLSHRLFEAEESERRRLARELHDSIGQNVTALTMNLNMVRGELPADWLQKVAAQLNDCETLLYSTGQLVRNVMIDLRPPGLDELGLLAALTEHARQVAARSGIPVTVSGTEIAPRLPPATEITLFRIAQEALVNVAKHARATEAAIALEAGPDKVIMTLSDNGCGFDAAAHLSRVSISLGMVSMRERAEAIGGRLRVESAPGRGTRVTVETPRANHNSANQPHLPGIEAV